MQPWMFVFATLTLMAYQLYSVRVHVLWRAIVPAVFPFLVFPPHRHETFRAALEAASTPWPSIVMALVILAYLRSSFRAPIAYREGSVS